MLFVSCFLAWGAELVALTVGRSTKNCIGTALWIHTVTTVLNDSIIYKATLRYLVLVKYQQF